MKSMNTFCRLEKFYRCLFLFIMVLLLKIPMYGQCPGSAAIPFDVARGGVIATNNAIISSLPQSVFVQDGGWDNNIAGILDISGDVYINGDMHLANGTGFNILSGGRLFVYGNAFIDSNATLNINTGANLYFYGEQWITKPGAIINNTSGAGTISYIMPRPAVGTNDVISGSNRFPSNATADTTTGNTVQFLDGGGVDMDINLAHYNAHNISLCNLDNSTALNSGDTRLKDTLFFAVNNGDVILNGNNFILSTTGTYAHKVINAPQAYFVTNGTGNLIKMGMANNAVYTFPVGQAESDYTPAIITNTSGNCNNYKVQVKSYANSGAVISGPAEGMDKAWQISADSGGTSNICLLHNSVTNAAGPASDGSDFNNTAAFVTQQNAPGVWSVGTQTDGGSSVSTHCGTFTLPNTAAVNSYFSKSSDPISPLPIILKEFDGNISYCQAHLTWRTSSEMNNIKFVIQYSTDGVQFTSIGEMKNNRGSVFSFNYSDLLASDNYFRLLIIDADNQTINSPVIKLHSDCQKKIDISIAPNPVKDMLVIKGLTANNRILIINANGQRLINTTAQDMLNIDVRSWASGLYTVIVMDNGNIVKTEKIVKY